IVVNARNELEKMVFLQIRALHVALILCKNIFLTVNIEITASTSKAALELKLSGKTGQTIHLVFKFDECLMVNDDLLDSIIHLFTRSGITEL
ncbi:7458_t:CDS:2, partial [Racocetra persica]